LVKHFFFNDMQAFVDGRVLIVRYLPYYDRSRKTLGMFQMRMSKNERRQPFSKSLLLVNWVMRLAECLVTRIHLKKIAIGVLRRALNGEMS
jgi:hypothetical protein